MPRLLAPESSPVTLLPPRPPISATEKNWPDYQSFPTCGVGKGRHPYPLAKKFMILRLKKYVCLENSPQKARALIG